ncbi:putative chitinase [Cricetibacter osteomyelitidis]|uniref:Putative chitinase n=1 Tax=Cricetibacter osteomyelitidis TaxID=1521931 RepID=A0A4R2SKT8_9PAST|nr:glycoside hydrolase family 19 protein [Cricetibacter osteomyelitidis]TCP88666.1 putative chitinase [Cricetibacter osteomyelitidis]
MVQNNCIQMRSEYNGKPVAVVECKKECCCNRDITMIEFMMITKSNTAKGYLSDLNKGFKKWGINTCIEKACFIAHTLKETANYTLLEEILVDPKDEELNYKGYKGRGLMQLTFEENYAAYGIAVANDRNKFLGKNKDLISKDKAHAVGSALWYWKEHRKLTNYALSNDFITTCAIINGGFNGFIDRKNFYKKALVAFNVKECVNLDKKVINMLYGYLPFEESYVYKYLIAETFGWGLWHDPDSKRKGTKKELKEAKKGYTRFLELVEGKIYPFGFNKTKKQERKSYGYTGTSAVNYAKNWLIKYEKSI